MEKKKKEKKNLSSMISLATVAGNSCSRSLSTGIIAREDAKAIFPWRTCHVLFSPAPLIFHPWTLRRAPQGTRVPFEILKLAEVRWWIKLSACRTHVVLILEKWWNRAWKFFREDYWYYLENYDNSTLEQLFDTCRSILRIHYYNLNDNNWSFDSCAKPSTHK